MEIHELLVEAYGRVNQLVHRALDGLDAEGLAFRPEPGANSIGWLVRHLTRVQDDHVAHILGAEQVWADRARVTRTGYERTAGPAR